MDRLIVPVRVRFASYLPAALITGASIVTVPVRVRIASCGCITNVFLCLSYSPREGANCIMAAGNGENQQL